MKISPRGQVTIPKPLRKKYGLTPNTEVEFIPEDDGVRIQKRRIGKHPVWEVIGLLGQQGNTDEYIERIRGR